jgi:hypothetical protein
MLLKWNIYYILTGYYRYFQKGKEEENKDDQIYERDHGNSHGWTGHYRNAGIDSYVYKLYVYIFIFICISISL